MDNIPKRVKENVSLKIKDINIGDRYREDMGDIENLAISIRTNGLLYPIIVSMGEKGKYDLVEGERRIHAAKKLGWTEIDCMLLESMESLRRKEIELVMCVQRKQLSFIEEARASKELVDRRRAHARRGGLARLSSNIRNKDVAMELNMSESRMSENLRIAEALEDHPELDRECDTRTEALRRIRRKDFYVPNGGYMQGTYEESFIVCSPMDCVTAVHDRIIDLAILHPDGVDEELLDATMERLKLAGQLIIFIDPKEIGKWEHLLAGRGLNTGPRPFMWHIRAEGDYQPYMWAATNRKQPMRPLSPLLSFDRPEPRFDIKAKPEKLMATIIKSCVDRGSFVVVPDCRDIQTVKLCVEVGVNVRASCADRTLRDKLILSVTEKG